MIDIKIRKTNSGCYKGFTVKGHAGFAESGSDIVFSIIIDYNSVDHVTGLTKDAFYYCGVRQ